MKLIQQPLFPDLMPRILPEKHYAWFRIANSHPSNLWKKRWWYPFKERFLARYAERDGYDVQHLMCRECGGAGEEVGCDRCDDGVYNKVPLERWKFPDGTIYHRPSSCLPAGRPDVYKQTFQGLLKHADVTEKSAVRAALKLFFRYNRSRFLELAKAELGGVDWLRQLRERQRALSWRLHCTRIRLHNKFWPPKPEDEVPF